MRSDARQGESAEIGVARSGDAHDFCAQGRSLPARIYDTDVVRTGEHRLDEIRKLLGALFQDGVLFGSLSLFGNIAFPLREHTRKKCEVTPGAAWSCVQIIRLGVVQVHGGWKINELAQLTTS